jgi:hypothetical protein
MEIKRKAVYLLSFASCFLFLTNCSFRKEIKRPANLISADTMEFIITDLTLTEAALNTGLPNDTVRKINVLTKYNINLQRFNSSFEYYTQNPRKLKDIYAKVLEDLNKK